MNDTEGDTGATPRHLLATLERLLAIQAATVKGALDEATEAIEEALGGDIADAFLYDRAIDSLVAVGSSSRPLARHRLQLGLDCLPIANGGRAVEVFQTGTSYRNGHAEDDVGMVLGGQQELGLRSMIIAPIQVRGECRGVFEVVSSWPDRFSPEDLRFCETVSRWVGMLVERAELAERIAREAAEQGRRMAAENLINVLAHDLRTPLTPLRGHLDMIRRRATQGVGQQDILSHAVEADRALRRLNGLIGDLLDAGRLEQGLFSLEVQPVDLVALVRDTVDLLRLPEVDIQVHGPDELRVGADPRRLRQALENLLNNALQHSPPATPVAVDVTTETRTEGEWAVLTVSDEGPGIASGLLPTLFDRYARGSHSTGLGLGLYLARGIAEAHGGTLTGESQEGNGSTFRLALPLSMAAQEARA